jgi:hypothetical protein
VAASAPIFSAWFAIEWAGNRSTKTSAAGRFACSATAKTATASSATPRCTSTKLPPITGDRPNLDGTIASADQKNASRNYGIARLERLAQDRATLITALDATFPDIEVPVKNLDAADPTQSCSTAAAQGRLHTELPNLLGRFTSLYDDGTIPASTETLGAGHPRRMKRGMTAPPNAPGVSS